MSKTIYFAGGCFWGVEAFFQPIKGVVATEVGYAQGHTINPSYELVCTGTTGATETVEIIYDEQLVTLSTLLDALFTIINPTSLNKQGGDSGTQYRTGIYSHDEINLVDARQYIQQKQNLYEAPIVVEVEPLTSFYPAEEYHQDYLQKNPGGYCHVNLALSKKFE